MEYKPLIADQEREAQRLAKLASFAILDTPPQAEFDTIVTVAARLLDCPKALLSLVDDHRQWFKARCGVEVSETPRQQAFCAHAMLVPDIMVVEDAREDPRFADNPLVTGAPFIRFYAGVPLRPSIPGFEDDLPGIGTLCVVDVKPRTLSQGEADLLRRLAGLASAMIVARSSTEAAVRLSVEKSEQAAAVARKHRQLQQAERMAGIGSWRLDLANQHIEWSDQVFAIHGLPVGEAPPLDDALNFFPESERDRVADLVGRATTDNEPFDFESDFIAADGRIRRVRSIGEPESIDGNPVAIIGVFQDVTDRHAQEQALRVTASTDALTGLPNRGCFEARLELALAQSWQSGAPLALLILDLDGFKAVNDSFGHAAGDEVLQAMAARLRGQDFANAFAARLGGDEFVMLVTRPRDCAELRPFISKLLGALRYDVERDGERRHVSATVGGSRLEPGSRSAAELLRQADLALYAAKREERGTGRLFGSTAPVRC